MTDCEQRLTILSESHTREYMKFVHYQYTNSISSLYRPGSNVAKPLPDNFTPEMVSGDVKETCLNWFYKVASIRELLPRLYLEIALIKSMSFLTQSEFNQTLRRLSQSCRGIGDPLIAAYARCYLCRVGPSVTRDTKYLEENLDDFLFVYHTVLYWTFIYTRKI